MNNITKIVLAVIAAVVIYFVLVKGPEQANSTQRTAGDSSSSRRPGTTNAGTTTNTGTSTNTPTSTRPATPTGTRPATPGNMNDREIDPSTTSHNRRFTTISLEQASDRVISDSRGTTTGNRTQGSSTRGTSTRGSSTTGTRTTSSTSSRTSGTGTNPRRVSRQYYPLQ